MARFRELVRRYPVAATAIALAVVALAGWRAYQTLAGPPAATPGATPTGGPRAPDTTSTGSPATAATGGPAATAPTSVAGAPGAPRPSEQAAGASQAPGGGSAPPVTAQAGTSEPTDGRPDPFISPLGAVAGGTARAGVGSLPLPPVPPLPPGPIGPSGAPVPPGAPVAPPQPVYRLTGILGDSTGLAIVEDGTETHIVAAGDLLAPGVRVVSVDPVRGVVALTRDGMPLQLRMDQGGNAR